jgi:hypothetical protein
MLPTDLSLTRVDLRLRQDRGLGAEPLDDAADEGVNAVRCYQGRDFARLRLFDPASAAFSSLILMT